MCKDILKSSPCTIEDLKEAKKEPPVRTNNQAMRSSGEQREVRIIEEVQREQPMKRCSPRRDCQLWTQTFLKRRLTWRYWLRWSRLILASKILGRDIRSCGNGERRRQRLTLGSHRMTISALHSMSCSTLLRCLTSMQRPSS
jgi:hypothetical protein